MPGVVGDGHDVGEGFKRAAEAAGLWGVIVVFLAVIGILWVAGKPWVETVKCAPFTTPSICVGSTTQWHLDNLVEDLAIAAAAATISSYGIKAAALGR